MRIGCEIQWISLQVQWISHEDQWFCLLVWVIFQIFCLYPMPRLTICHILLLSVFTRLTMLKLLLVTGYNMSVSIHSRSWSHSLKDGWMGSSLVILGSRSLWPVTMHILWWASICKTRSRHCTTVSLLMFYIQYTQQAQATRSWWSQNRIVGMCTVFTLGTAATYAHWHSQEDLMLC